MHKDILMWIQNGDVVKGEINFDTGTVIFFDRFNNILMRRQGLKFKQLMKIKKQIQERLSIRKHIGFYYV